MNRRQMFSQGAALAMSHIVARPKQTEPSNKMGHLSSLVAELTENLKQLRMTTRQNVTSLRSQVEELKNQQTKIGIAVIILALLG